jgi:hypothetical protein
MLGYQELDKGSEAYEILTAVLETIGVERGPDTAALQWQVVPQQLDIRIPSNYSYG